MGLRSFKWKWPGRFSCNLSVCLRVFRILLILTLVPLSSSMETEAAGELSIPAGSIQEDLARQVSRSRTEIEAHRISVSTSPREAQANAASALGANARGTLQQAEAEGIVYLATAAEIARARDFYDSAGPHWESVKGDLPSIPITELVLDPFDPIDRAWVSLGDGHSGSDGAIWRTDNLDDPVPTWVGVLDEDEILDAIGGDSAWVKRIQASQVQPGLIFIAVGRGRLLSVGRSEDYGAAWTWAINVGETVTAPVGFELSPHDPDRLWVGMEINNSPRVIVSNDRGDAFTALPKFGHWWDVYDIHVPEAGNRDDHTIFAVLDNEYRLAGQLYRSLDGGQHWVDLGVHPARTIESVQSAATDADQLYFVDDFWGCDYPEFLYSQNGGDTWEERSLPRNAHVWGLPAEGERLLAAFQCEGSELSSRDRYVAFYSGDGGYSWEYKTGDWWDSMGSYAGGGFTSAKIFDAVAYANRPISQADLAVALSAPSEAPPGGLLSYRLTLRNLSENAAEGVVLRQELPPNTALVDHTAPTEPTQTDRWLEWDIGTLAGEGKVSFSVVVEISPTASVGGSLASTLGATSATADAELGNNQTSGTTEVVPLYEFSSDITPGETRLHLGGSARYLIEIRNTGWATDRYTIGSSGLEAGWAQLSQEEIILAPGESGAVELIVAPMECVTEGSIPFTVTVRSEGSGDQELLSASLDLVHEPLVELLEPDKGAQTGSRTVLFHWRTDPATTSTLLIHPAGEPEEVQSYTTAEGMDHSVQVEDMTRNTAYEWWVRADSGCGSASSQVRALMVSNGIVFGDRELSFTIDRDYNQQAQVRVANQDLVPHTLKVELENPHEDLIANFVGSGSIDEEITLLPRESRMVRIAIHAQDASSRSYDLVARLTADEGEESPITDSVRLDLRVLFEADFSLEEVGADPLSGARSYRVVNHGKPLTDLSIRAVDPQNGEPARVLIVPSVSHAYLGTDQDLAFDVLPIYGPQDVAEEGSASASGGKAMASPTNGVGIGYELVASAGDILRNFAGSITCGAGRAIHAVSRENVCQSFSNADWYCTNRPEISFCMDVPYYVNPGNLHGARLQVSFDPHEGVLPHTTSLLFNGDLLGTLSNTIPRSLHQWSVPASSFNFYTLEARIKYLDRPELGPETVPLFDDGDLELHGDEVGDDREFNARWMPSAGGQMAMTVIATAPNGAQAADRDQFTVDALPDFVVVRVWQNAVSLEQQETNVRAEITNRGFAVQGPLFVEFRYFNADEETGEPVGIVPIHTSRYALFEGDTFERGETVTVVDSDFVAPELGLYYVEVVVDPEE